MSESTKQIHHSVDVPADKVHKVLSGRILADGFDFVLDLDKSQGAYLYDERNGRRYLDLFTFFASNPIGMNHPMLRNDEFIKKIGTAAINKPSNSDIYTTEMAEFVETFFRVAVPEGYPHAFFISGGALAVENALKTAIDWKVRKNLAADRGEIGTKVLHFRWAFHGRTGYTMSLTNTDPVKVQYWPKFDWPRVDNPYAEFPLEGDNLARTEARENETLRQIHEAFDQNPNEIACIILEPIQGEGGDNHFRPEFLQQLRNICDEKEAMLIFDEVQTGVGLTGRMWACQKLGVMPDIIAFGKKAQVCGIIATNRVDEVDDNVFQMSSRINSTWGGNLVDMIRFQRFLEVIDQENLVENADRVGGYLLDELKALTADHPELLQNPRGEGLLCAVTVSSKQKRDAILSGCLERGVMIIGAGERAIRFRPPLNLTTEQVDEGMAVIRESIKSLA